MTATSFMAWVARLVPRWWIAALFALMVLTSLLEGIGILLLVPFLATLLDSGTDNPFTGLLLKGAARLGISPTAEFLLLAFVILIALRAALVVLRDRVGNALQHHVVDGLRRTALECLLGAEWRWISGRRRSDYTALVTMEIARIGQGLRDYITMFAAGVGIVAYLMAAVAISPAMSALALITGLVIYALMSRIRRRAVALGQDMSSANRAMMATVEESLGAIKLAKILGTERRHLDLLMATIARVRLAQTAFLLANSYAQALWQIIAAAMLASYAYAGIRWLAVDPPSLFTLVLVFGRLSPQFLQMQQAHNRWLHALPVQRHVDTLLRESRAAAEPRAVGPVEPIPVRQDVRLEGVGLTYAERSAPAVADISLVLPARTTTVVMGPSGSGKSTLADILVGLTSPDRGRLVVDGATIGPHERRRWLRSVSYIPQDVTLFHDTVRGNLLWGAPHVGDDALADALRRASADFAYALPQGLDTVVGDGGVRLSGGERQRLAIARALLRRAEFLILDEATSALDLANEAQVHEAIAALHGDLTIVLIGHRLPMLDLADQVVTLAGGQIASIVTATERKMGRPA